MQTKLEAALLLAWLCAQFLSTIPLAHRTLSVTSDGDRLRPAEVCHQVSLDVKVNLNKMLFSTWIVPLCHISPVCFPVTALFIT